MENFHPSLNADNFLAEMVQDPYYPPALVKKGQHILVQLCQRLTQSPPANITALYQETNIATEQFNALKNDFDEQDSEIETVARECIATEMYNIAVAYGFSEADREKLVEERDW